MSESTKKTIVLKSSDGESFVVEEAVALLSQTIAHMVEDDCADNGIPLANVTGNVLSKVIDYCKKHADGEGEGSSSEEDLKKWDAEFMKTHDHSTIFDLILAANYLNIKSLLELTCQTIADEIAACKTAEQIRAKFGIENDFTPEEEEEVRKENQWAFE